MGEEKRTGPRSGGSWDKDKATGKLTERKPKGAPAKAKPSSSKPKPDASAGTSE